MSEDELVSDDVISFPFTVNYSITVEYFDINKPVNIVLPDESENAIDVTEMIKN